VRRALNSWGGPAGVLVIVPIVGTGGGGVDQIFFQDKRQQFLKCRNIYIVFYKRV